METSPYFTVQIPSFPLMVIYSRLSGFSVSTFTFASPEVIEISKYSPCLFLNMARLSDTLSAYSNPSGIHLISALSMYPKPAALLPGEVCLFFSPESLISNCVYFSVTVSIKFSVARRKSSEIANTDVNRSTEIARTTAASRRTLPVLRSPARRCSLAK